MTVGRVRANPQGLPRPTFSRSSVRMMASWVLVSASDMHETFFDSLRYLGQPDSTQAGQSQDVNLSPQQGLQILDQLHELEADGMLELNDKVDVAGGLGSVSREGAEQSDPLNPELSGELRVALPEAAEDGLFGEAVGGGGIRSHDGTFRSVQPDQLLGTCFVTAPRFEP